jgi:hypothetical protein
MIVGLPAMTGTATAAYIGYDDTSARFTTTAACTTHLDFGLRIPVVHLTHIPYPPMPEPSPRKSPPLPAGPRPIALSPPAGGHLLPLPVGSHSRFEKSWGDLISSSSTMAIEQAGDSALIQVFGGNFPYQPTECQTGMREGRISASEFRTFWDSLGQLGFWQLKNEYEGRAEYTGEEGGSISVSSEDSSGAKTGVFRLYRLLLSQDKRFRFKIYGGDGHTLLYQSPVLKANPSWDGREVVHELSTPLLVDSGQFYLSVAPMDTIGWPKNLAGRARDDQHWPGATTASTTADSSSQRSLFGSPGNWFPMLGELPFSVLLRR